jgi:hypothetical protein
MRGRVELIGSSVTPRWNHLRAGAGPQRLVARAWRRRAVILPKIFFVIELAPPREEVGGLGSAATYHKRGCP